MTGKFSFGAAVIVAGLFIANTSGMAATSTSLSALRDVGASRDSTIEKVLWRRGCHWGIGGYHKWVPGVGRVQCTARKCWTNSWGIRRCRWF